MLNVINALNNSQLICFPTETVYALSCSADDVYAIDKIYRVKKRNKNKPLSLFIANIKQLNEIAAVKKSHLTPIKRFTPGPITFVLPLRKDNKLSKEFFKNTIGIRIPSHPTALRILNEFNGIMVATSVNTSGEKSVSKAYEIPNDIRKEVSIIIDDDRLVIGVESTIVDLTTDEISILREGRIADKDIKTVFSNYGKHNRA